jgi:hypothetical protein
MRPEERIMRIYRIEDKYGCGYFWSGMAAEVSLRVLQDLIAEGWDVDGATDERYRVSPGRHPAPKNDRGLSEQWKQLEQSGITNKFHFGFTSLASLLHWFDSERHRRAMHSLGCVVAVYETDHWYEGHYQAIFQKCKATRIDTLPVPLVAEVVSCRKP